MGEERRLVDEGAPGRVDQGHAVRHRRQLRRADHAVRGRELGRVDRDDRAAGAQFVEADELHAGRRDVDVRVVQQDLDVEGAQQVDDPAADARGADDADGAAVVAPGGGLLQPGVVGAQFAVPLGRAQDPLPGEEDRGERVLGDRQRVGRGGRGDAQAALPAGVGDVVLDGAGRVDDGAQPGRAVEDLGGERGRSPAGEEDLGLGEGGGDPRVRAGQVVGDQVGVGVGEGGEAGAVGVREEAIVDSRAHGQEDGGAVVSGRVHRGTCAPHLTLPAVRPAFQWRWRETKATTRGTTASRDPVTTRG